MFVRTYNVVTNSTPMILARGRFLNEGIKTDSITNIDDNRK